MVRTIERSAKFINQVRKTDKSLLDHVKKLLVKIIENPDIGKPMKYDRRGTREVYAGSFRVSYSYDKSSDTLFLINLYHKDEQ